MHTNTRRRRLSACHIYVVVFLVMMVVTNIGWIRVNKAPPRMYDDALYHAESVQLYRILKSGNLDWFWLEFTNAARGIHPPMVKIFPVPFHLLFGPEPRSALYAMTALIPVFALYVFLIAGRLFGSNRTAFVAMAITCLFPLSYGMWRHMMAEFGTAVAATGAVYHLHRSDGFRKVLHSLIFAIFVSWGLWWKASFPLFVLPLMLYTVAVGFKARRYTAVFVNVLLVTAAAVLLVLPFYLKSGKAVLGFAAFAAETNSMTELWSLGPPLWPSTLARYWAGIINSGVSAYVFVVLTVFASLNLAWRRKVGLTSAWLVLALWFVPAWLFFSVQLMKEERHLLPAYPVLGIAFAALAAPTLDRFKAAGPAAAACLLLWPCYQYLASSFDHRLLPRPDIRLGPLAFLVKNLELASLQLLPSYTFPASPVRWPAGDVVTLIASNSSDVASVPPRLKVVGDNPFLSGVVIYHESVVRGVPLTSHGAFYKGLNINWDFLLELCGPEHVYGPLDEREPVVSALLRAGKLPFRPIGAVRLPSGCGATVYKRSLTDSLLTSDLARAHQEAGIAVAGMGQDGQLELSGERTLPLVYIPGPGATLFFDDNATPEQPGYKLHAIEFDVGQRELEVETVAGDADRDWVRRKVGLQALRGRIVDLKFVVGPGIGRTDGLRLRNLRLQGGPVVHGL